MLALACAPLLLSVLATGAVAAPHEPGTENYAEQSDLDSAMIENFGVSSEKMFVMDPETSKLDGDEVFYPMPQEAEDALFIAPDLASDIGLEAGEVPADETAEVAKDLLSINAGETPQSDRSTSAALATPANAKGPCWTGFYTPVTGKWSSWGNRRCSQIGNKYGRQVYNFQLIYSSDGAACGQGIGYVGKYEKGIFKGVTKKTYGLGCGKSGSRNVPWENSAGYPKFRSKSAYLGFGTYGTWS